MFPLEILYKYKLCGVELHSRKRKENRSVGLVFPLILAATREIIEAMYHLQHSAQCKNPKQERTKIGWQISIGNDMITHHL